MNRPGVINGIIAALLISLGSAVIMLLASALFAYSDSFSLVISAASLAYLVYLLKYSGARVGKVIVIAAWAMASSVCWLIDLPLIEQVLIQAGLIWLVRSLYFYGSVASAMLDFGLVSAGLAASTWAIINTGSLAAALWSFFLVQALFCWIPDVAGSRHGSNGHGNQNTTAFQSAHRVALDAVRKLSQP